MKIKPIALAVSASAALGTSAVFADTSKSLLSENDGEYAGLILEEIVVTARKRAEDLQDVPVSVSAVSAEKLNEIGALRMEDVAAYVPNLIISESGLSDEIYMRGLGSGENSGFEQSVGVYIDGIYYGRGNSIRDGLLDVERVEVLRGPQGVLFGKNTIAGAINVTTASSGEEVEGRITLGYTPELNGKEVTTVVSGALSETLGARLAYRHTQSDGWMENNGFGGRSEPRRDSDVMRLTLDWHPSEQMSARFKWTHGELDEIGQKINLFRPI